MTTAQSAIGQRHAPVQAMLMLLTAHFVWSVHDTVIKLLTAGYSPAQIMFFGRLLSIPVSIMLAARLGGLAGLRTKRPLLHVCRGLTSTADMMLFVGALALAPLADVFVISFATPLIMLVLATAFLGERPPIGRWIAVFLGFSGVVVAVLGMQSPESAEAGRSATALAIEPLGLALTNLQLATVFALGSAVIYAVFLILTRDMTRTESAPALMLWNSTVVMAVMIVVMLPTWKTPTGSDEIWLFAFISLTGVVGQLLTTEAYRYGEASLLAPLQYTSLIWATLAGYMVFGDMPTPMLLAGAAIIIASALYIAQDEARSYRRAVRNAK